MFETYVKSHISKTCGQLSMTTCLFETYVKSFTSKAFGGNYIDFCWFEIYVKQRKIDRKFSDLFETYVKWSTSKTNIETLEFDRV